LDKRRFQFLHPLARQVEGVDLVVQIDNLVITFINQKQASAALVERDKGNSIRLSFRSQTFQGAFNFRDRGRLLPARAINQVRNQAHIPRLLNHGGREHRAAGMDISTAFLSTASFPYSRDMAAR
jgi:hypothetical protein